MAGGPASLLASELCKGVGQSSEEAGVGNRRAVVLLELPFILPFATRVLATFWSSVFTPIQLLTLALIP